MAKTVITGTEKVLNRLGDLTKLAITGTEKGLEAMANQIARKSQMQVPLDKSTLLKSLKNERVDKDTIEISYNTPYATRWHYEKANFKGGRKTHYLTDPMRDAMGSFANQVTNAIRQLMK